MGASFRPLDAVGDAAARRPCHREMYRYQGNARSFTTSPPGRREAGWCVALPPLRARMTGRTRTNRSLLPTWRRMMKEPGKSRCR